MNDVRQEQTQSARYSGTDKSRRLNRARCHYRRNLIVLDAGFALNSVRILSFCRDQILIAPSVAPF